MGSQVHNAPKEVYQVWRVRERVELEASYLFWALAEGIKNIRGTSDPIKKLAEKAALDEKKHATLCRAILNDGKNPPDPLRPALGIFLGPPGLDLPRCVLYTCVALGCITETLSTALLVEMQKGVLNGLVRNTVHEILEDEISHSRIGWAELARFANESEVNWLSRYIPLMLSDAMGSESEPLLNVSKAHEDLSAFGILSPVGARGLMIEAVNEIILPGLRQYGVETIHAEKYLSSFTIGLF